MPPHFSEFLERLGAIKKEADALPEYVDSAEKLARRAASAVLGAEQEPIAAEMGALSKTFKRLARDIKRKVDDLEKEHEVPGEDEKQLATKAAQTRGLRSRVRRSIDAFLKAETDFIRIEEERVRALYRAADPGATEDELERLGGEGGEGLLKSKFALDSRTSRRIMEEIQRRQSSTQRLNADMDNLAEITGDLEEEIVKGGEKIDRVRERVSASGSELNISTRQMEKATRYRKRMTKVKTILAGALLLVLLVGGIYLLGRVTDIISVLWPRAKK